MLPGDPCDSGVPYTVAGERGWTLRRLHLPGPRSRQAPCRAAIKLPRSLLAAVMAAGRTFNAHLGARRTPAQVPGTDGEEVEARRGATDGGHANSDLSDRSLFHSPSHFDLEHNVSLDEVTLPRWAWA
jgi:hypothetical protein